MLTKASTYKSKKRPTTGQRKIKATTASNTICYSSQINTHKAEILVAEDINIH